MENFNEQERKEILINNINRKWNLNKEEYNENSKNKKFLSFSFSGSSGKCGDFLNFLVHFDKESRLIRKILFNNQECCIFSSSFSNVIIELLVERNYKLEDFENLFSGKNLSEKRLSFLKESDFKTIKIFECSKKEKFSKKDCFKTVIYSFKNIIFKLKNIL